jgi:cbb3-type cytochrome oxidase maturation protein
MSVVFVLVFAAIIMAGAFLIAFIWSVKNGQYEDTYTPSVRMLFDDPPVKEEKKEKDEKSPIPNPSPKGKGV